MFGNGFGLPFLGSAAYSKSWNRRYNTLGFREMEAAEGGIAGGLSRGVLADNLDLVQALERRATAEKNENWAIQRLNTSLKISFQFLIEVPTIRHHSRPDLSQPCLEH